MRWERLCCVNLPTTMPVAMPPTEFDDNAPLPTELEFDDALPLSSIKLLGPGAAAGVGE